MDTLKISIITVCYNFLEADRRKYFLEMLSSIHNQTHKNFEHIIIDGASSDGSFKFIKDIILECPENIKENTILRSEPDSGIYNAMNKGISQASGDYLIFINTDDHLFSPTALESVCKALQSSKAKIAFGSTKIIHTRELKKNESDIFSPHVSEYIFRIPCSHQATFCHNSLFKKYGLFDETFEYLADYDFICKTLRGHESFTVVDKIVSVYRIDGISGFTSSKDLLNQENCRIIAKNLANEPAISESDIKELLFEKFTIRNILRYNKIIKSPYVKNVLVKSGFKKILRKRLGKGIYRILLKWYFENDRNKL